MKLIPTLANLAQPVLTRLDPELAHTLTIRVLDKRGFDRILLDVPCSGSGVVRRHPDIKWIRREADIYAFARQQARRRTTVMACPR